MRLTLVFLALAAVANAAHAADDPQLLQKPTLSSSQIVFVFAGDLWAVGRQGGDAVRLTNGAGVETDPMFSPDGTRIAFTGEYDGNVDVFTVSASGGVPKRLTWHPAPDRVVGWTPDGARVVFASNRTAYSRFVELFSVPADGGVEEKLPLPSGVSGSFSPDGQSIAYEPIGRAFLVWKNYRGGQTSRIWLARLSDSVVTKVPRTNSNDFNPMWAGGRVYFLSDRNGPVTLFYYDTATKVVREAFSNRGLDLKSASLGPGAIVYEQVGGISLFDLKSGTTTLVAIRVHGDFPEMRAKFVNVSKRLGSPAVSPTGARALFTALGEVLTVPAEKGDPRNLTNSPGVMERDPQWSPDGRTIAYLSDESGEYALHVRAQDGTGDIVKIPLKPGFYQMPRFSPDNRKVALVDSFQRLSYVDLGAKKQIDIDQDTYQMRASNIAGAWSPDSQWLAYSKVLANGLSAIHLYSLGSGKTTPVTDGMSDATSPVFDKDGKYLFFVASTNSGESLALDIRGTGRSSTSALYLVVLDKSQPSPFSPESDEEKPEAADTSQKGEPVAGKGAPTVQIDLDGIDQRILSVPMPARRYASLQVGKTGTLLALEVAPEPDDPPPGPPAPRPITVHRYDLKARRSDVPLAGVTSFQMSFGGEKALYRQGDNWTIAALRPMAGPGAAGASVPSSPPASPPSSPQAAPSPAAPGAGVMQTANIEVRTDPVESWKQMYREVWRIERDWFYDRRAHGVDLKLVEERYTPYLRTVASRQDLTYLFQEMLGNLTVSHMAVGGGDLPEVKRVQTGLLGADYEVAEGRYRFSHVYNGENWNPQLRAPLTQPGVNVKAGEYLLAVNGREVRTPGNVYSFFEGLADKSVVLKVGPRADGDGAREVTVVPVADESRLRNLAWVEANRRKVDQLSGGSVGYIYMPNTGNGGLAAFNRYFYAQIGKQALIVDERFNAGGMLGTDIAEVLSRKVLSAAANRAGQDLVQPQGIFGPKVMIINETAGSGGDALPWYFRRAGVGTLVGTRTWGGLVGMAGSPPLMDGGFVGAPSSGIYNPLSGEWEVENIGIAPDIEVEQDPALVRAGHDPQLEKAVETVLSQLKQTPPPSFRRPQFPNYGTAPGATAPQ